MIKRHVLLPYNFLVFLSFPFFKTKIQRATFCGQFPTFSIELSHRVFGIRSLPARWSGGDLFFWEAFWGT